MAGVELMNIHAHRTAAKMLTRVHTPAHAHMHHACSDPPLHAGLGTHTPSLLVSPQGVCRNFSGSSAHPQGTRCHSGHSMWVQGPGKRRYTGERVCPSLHPGGGPAHTLQ